MGVYRDHSSPQVPCDDGRVPEPSEPRPYPPRTVWHFPPPPVSRLWLVAAIVGGLLGVGVTVAAFTFMALNVDRDIPGFIDDQRVVEIAERECKLMTSTVEGLEKDGRPGGRLDVLADQNSAVTTMVDRIRLIASSVREADRPVDDWLEDWEALVAGREDYLGKQRRGVDADFRVPRTRDGDPITERMELAAEEVCPVPDVLLEPELTGTQPV